MFLRVSWYLESFCAVGQNPQLRIDCESCHLSWLSSKKAGGHQLLWLGEGSSYSNQKGIAEQLLTPHSYALLEIFGCSCSVLAAPSAMKNAHSIQKLMKHLAAP